MLQWKSDFIMIKKKRIQYNELNEEIYAPIYWTKFRLISIGFILLFLGFLANFSLEERLNKFLQSKLSSNPSCPIIFEKAELSYFLPTVTIKKPVIQGVCFGQYNNKLTLKDVKLSLHSPSFYPPGMNFHVEISSGKSIINLYPAVSLFSQLIEIDKTSIDASLFAPLIESNTSPIAGVITIEGFFKYESGAITDGQLDINSKNFSLPSQNIKGFEVPQINLGNLNIKAHFSDQSTMVVDRIVIGRSGAPIDLALKGKIGVNHNNFMNSSLNLNGDLKLSSFILSNFSFIKLFLPADNTSGNYKMKLSGTLKNPGAPRFE